MILVCCSCWVFFFLLCITKKKTLKDKIIRHKEMRTKIYSWRTQVSCKRTRISTVRRLQGRLMATRSNSCYCYLEFFFFHPLTLPAFYLATMHLIFDFKQQNEMKQFQEEHTRCMMNWENGLVGGSDLRIKRTLHRELVKATNQPSHQVASCHVKYNLQTLINLGSRHAINELMQ